MNDDKNNGIRPTLISIALVVLVLLFSVPVLAELSALRHLWQHKDILLLHTLEQTVLALESETNTATELTNSIRWLWSYTYEINHYNGYVWLGEIQPYIDEISSLIGGVSRGTVNEESLSRLRNHLEGLLFRLRDYSPGRGPFRREVRRTILDYVDQRSECV